MTENSRDPVTISRTARTESGNALQLRASVRLVGSKRRDERLHTVDGPRATKFLERRPDIFLGPARPATVIADIWVSSANMVPAIDINGPAGDQSAGRSDLG